VDDQYDLVGFNDVVLEDGARRPLNSALIPCVECVTGDGHTYNFLVTKHRNIRKIYIEAVHVGGGTELFGPVLLSKVPTALRSTVARPPEPVLVP
jgi:hypothetical protein